MSTLFVLKNVPVFFFQECRNIWTKLCQIQPPPPPPPPSLFVSKQCRISIFEDQNTVHVSFTLLEGDWGGWGELSRMCLKPCFPACGKKNTGTFWHFVDESKIYNICNHICGVIIEFSWPLVKPDNGFVCRRGLTFPCCPYFKRSPVQRLKNIPLVGQRRNDEISCWCGEQYDDRKCTFYLVGSSTAYHCTPECATTLAFKAKKWKKTVESKLLVLLDEPPWRKFVAPVSVLG